MVDLISREAAIEAAIDGADDWDGGYNPERERYIREYMAKVSAVDAIPVEWLRSQLKNNPNDIESAYDDICINEFIDRWQKEQESESSALN